MGGSPVRHWYPTSDSRRLRHRTRADPATQADVPLVIDAKRVLPAPVSYQCFEAIGRPDAQLVGKDTDNASLLRGTHDCEESHKRHAIGLLTENADRYVQSRRLSTGACGTA